MKDLAKHNQSMKCLGVSSLDTPLELTVNLRAREVKCAQQRNDVLSYYETLMLYKYGNQLNHLVHLLTVLMKIVTMKSEYNMFFWYKALA